MSLFARTIALREGAKITDEEFVQLRDFVYDQCGIWVDEKRKYLFESRFTTRLSELGLRSFGEYYNYLKYDTKRSQELIKLFEVVTTNETSFYRDIPQLNSFRDNVLAKVIESQRAAGRKELNIWSAGCSSGEEPYTLSILLHEMLGREILQWRIRITAVDLSKAMIAKAQDGVYAEYSFKTTPEQARKRYFTEEKDGWRIRPELGRICQFKVMNLNDRAALKTIPRSHIVFCRNCIIYFDEAMKKRVVGAFYDNLLPGGYLMLGHSETLHKISSAFKVMHFPGTMAYKKDDDSPGRNRS